MNTSGNLVLGRYFGQSVFIGEKENEVKLTVKNLKGIGQLTFQSSNDSTVTPMSSRMFSVCLSNGDEVLVTIVENNGKQLKLAFQAERHVIIDREEIRARRIGSEKV